ncbi:MAG: archaellum component FlaF (FlaF/FlaG flagellin family) [Candidatus Nitrosomirales archaeon]|jgi:archaellum component FlaF (FlaF/FlaG flagellin family)
MSVVVTTLLLVAAVGVMGTFLLAWSNSSFAAQQFIIANQTASRINLIKESFVVEDVWFYGSGLNKKADLTIRNTGDLALTISKVYINNTQVWSVGQVITPDQTAKITVDTQWSSGDGQLILVKTARGSEAKQVWRS